jgi:glycosyltransferase involved in cell wall biosynthesis
MQVSVIVPSFNHQDYIVQCLDSILENHVEGTELLICDDHSSDNSVQIIEKWLAENGTSFEKSLFVRHDHNIGITATLNEIIALCSGDYISMLASDDYYMKDGLNARIETMNANPQWMGLFSDGIAFGNAWEIYTESLIKSAGIDNTELSQEKITSTVLNNWEYPMNLQFWRRDAFKSHLGEFEFDESIYCEDLNFAIWALSRNAFGYLNKKCVGYRCREWPQQSYAKSDHQLSLQYADMAKCYELYAEKYPNKYQRIIKSKIKDLKKSSFRFRNINKKNIYQAQKAYINLIVNFLKTKILDLIK